MLDALAARRTRSRSLLLAAPVFAALATSATAQPKPVPAQDPLQRWNESVDVLTRRVWPSVVQIMVSSFGPSQTARGSASVVVGPQQSVGSGFVIDADGYIMTNAHVVAGAQRVQVMLPPVDADGSLNQALSSKMRIVPARVVGITAEIDLALLKVDDLKLPALPLAAYREVRQGETVFAFGSPGGLRNTLTHGLISSVARQIDPDSPLIYIQTDAPINPGNSGGPLVNIRGEVVGVNTFIISQSGGNEGLGFAIPSATARTVFRQLKQHGQLRRQEIGMSYQTITPTMAASLGLMRDYGVIVSDVWPGGPAEAAGLKVGDVLVTIDGQAADNLPSVNYFFRLRDSNENVQLVVLRGNMQHTLSIAAVEDRNEFESLSATADPKKNIVQPLGILGVEIDPKMAGAARGLRDPYGVVVVARVAGAGADVPLLVRDVIRSINNKPVVSLNGLREALAGMTPGAAVTLQVQREGRLLYVPFMLE
jgi:serine protease Do